MDYPDRIEVMCLIRGDIHVPKTFRFDRVAPITGDGVYRREDDNGSVIHALLVNPHGREQQLGILSRGKLSKVDKSAERV